MDLHPKANEYEMIPEYLTKVNELCEKVAENPERHEAFLMQDDVGYIIPVSRILEITAEKHKQEIADFQRRYDECVRKFNEADADRCRIRDENASLRSLVRELACALELRPVCGGNCEKCKSNDICRFNKERALIAKAWEMCK
mgnify:CR=1 FL=1